MASERRMLKRLGWSLAGMAVTAGALYAADGWNPQNPYWCHAGSQACGLWASETQYVGPTFTGCDGVQTGWRSEAYLVEKDCNLGS